MIGTFLMNQNKYYFFTVMKQCDIYCFIENMLFGAMYAIAVDLKDEETAYLCVTRTR